MKEFGAQLKTTREEAGLSLEDVNDATRISMKNLRLIESGDFPSLPQTYVRAFVREYARAIGLDEEETLATYNELAEREKGIPRPPDSIDSSNLLPQMDDSIEFIEPMNRPPQHVEVQGRAEIADDDEEYIPPVRKSQYVSDSDSEAIDIRTSTSRQEDVASSSKSAEQQTDSEGKQQSGTGEKPAAKEPGDLATASGKTAASERTASQKKDQGTADSAHAASEGKQSASASTRSETRQTDEPAEKKRDRKSISSKRVYDTKPPLPDDSDKNDDRKTPRPAPASDSPNEKRIIGVGLLVIAFIAIVAYGLFYFSQDSARDTAAVDSTAIKASIEAGRFIDSSQYAMTEMDMVPEDTLPQEPLPAPDPVEAKPRVFEEQDSLVLEAFTSAPVWFSVKMDTLRTERGSLSSNEHKVWKARDYFVITLGDAGAVTFFLNGKEIGTLGEEGAVAKNVTLSRRQLNGE